MKTKKRSPRRYTIAQSKTRTYNGQPLWALKLSGQEKRFFIDERSARIALNTIQAEQLIQRSYIGLEGLTTTFTLQK